MVLHFLSFITYNLWLYFHEKSWSSCFGKYVLHLLSLHLGSWSQAFSAIFRLFWWNDWKLEIKCYPWENDGSKRSPCLIKKWALVWRNSTEQLRREVWEKWRAWIFPVQPGVRSCLQWCYVSSLESREPDQRTRTRACSRQQVDDVV